LATLCFEEENKFRHNFESVSPYGDFRQKKEKTAVSPILLWHNPRWGYLNRIPVTIHIHEFLEAKFYIQMGRSEPGPTSAQ
jgi:hypothetical protein